MQNSTPRISDAEAAELWKRAAELQEAIERETSAGQLAPGERDDQLSLEHVAQVAEAVGIHPDNVMLAMAEKELPDAVRIRRDDWKARWLRRTVSDIDAIDCRRFIRAAPDRVFAALQRTAANAAYNLILENRLGTDPLRDGVLVYRIQGSTDTSFNNALTMSDARVLLVTIRAARDGSNLRVRVPLFRRGVNLSLAGVTTSLAGMGGSWSGWSLGALVAGAFGAAATPLLLVPAGIGAVVGGTLGLSGYRALYHGLTQKGSAAVQGFIGTVAVEAEMGGAGSAGGNAGSAGEIAGSAGIVKEGER